MASLQRLVAILTFVLRLFTGLSFAVLIAAVMVQVVSRGFLSSSPVWTEEMTRFALLFLAALGSGLALRSGDLVNVDILIETFGEKVSWYFRLLAAVLTAGLAGILLPSALRFMSIGAMQTSPALGLRMDFAHGAMVALYVSLFLFAVLRVVGMLAGTEDGRTTMTQE